MKIEKSWKINEKDIEGLSHIKNVLSKSIKYYKKRIQKIGFVGKNTRLLDAACGAGVWGIAASYLNYEVYGIDSTEKYLKVASDIQKNLIIANLKLEIGRLEKLPYPDKYFDYIICYNAWMYTQRKRSLGEMFRILKPGGKIYLGCISGLGYYLILAFEALRKGDRSLFFTALKAIKNRVYMTEKESRNLIGKQGFKITRLSVSPDFSLKKKGYVFEIIAIKDN